MRLLIDKNELELLLEKKRDFIGNKVTFDTVIAGVSFLLSVLTASYSDVIGGQKIVIQGIVLKTFFCTVGVVYVLKIIVDIIKRYRNKYDHIVLKNEIENLNMIQHDHSLVILCNSESSSEKEYLVYYDERWDCKLFLNYKTQERNNESYISDKISADLQVGKDKINLRYITSRVQEKYSVSHDEKRTYNHRLYELQISDWTAKKQKDFVINGKHYYWMPISKMETDKNIAKKNLEVVDFVKESLREKNK